MRRAGALLLLCTVAHAGSPAAVGPGLRADAPADANRPYGQELHSSAAPDLCLVLAGSVTIDAREPTLPSWDPQVLALLGGRDTAGCTPVAVAPLSTSLLDDATFHGFPYPWESRPVYRAPASVARELRQRGLAMVARADAHALDWGIEGMRATSAALDAAEIKHAGTGERDGLARSPTFLDEPDGKGRIALVATATTFRPTSNALAPWGAAPGRPGISAIIAEPTHYLPDEQRAELQRISCQFQYPADTAQCERVKTSPALTAFGSRFSAESPGDRAYTTRYALNQDQETAELRFVREAKQNADLAIFAVSTDQADRAGVGTDEPSSMLSELAHRAIEAGADMVVATGRGAIGPIEIDRTAGHPPRPIFYGLGNLYWSPGTGPGGSAPELYEALIVRSRVAGSGLVLELYPVDLHAPATDPGLPVLASTDRAHAILERLQRLCAPYHTVVTIEGFGTTQRGVVTATAANVPTQDAAR